MSRKPASLDLDEDDELPAPPAAQPPASPPVDKDLANVKPKAPGAKPDMAAVAAATESSGFTRDAPGTPSAPRPVEPSPSTVKAEPAPDLPWHEAGVRPNRREPFNLRMREPTKRMLDFLEQEGRIRSMNSYLNEIIEGPIRDAIVDTLVNDFGMTKREARQAVEREGEGRE
tara:strand:- start:42 stop:557 length:516 start_codon:yes stop_codon:yes gene_type:complete